MNTRERRGRLLPHLLCALVLHAAGASALLAAPPDFPPLVSPATTEHHAGKVVWVELVTPDLAGAKRFYSGLLGWTFRDAHTGKTPYVVALVDGRPVGGLHQRPEPSTDLKQPAWLTFLAVRDADAVKRAALEHGAKLVSDARSYPQRGRQAIFTDPEGAAFAVLASSSGDPSDVLTGPGEWIWSSLIVADPDKEAAFYQALFGYDVFDLPSDGGAEHLVLSTDDTARASVNGFHKDSFRRYPHWLNFVRVADAVAMAARASALGGRVLVEPHLDRQGGMLAVVADPTGAPFGLMEWSDTDTKKEPK
jgi:predicted enzyme related to lactoylglutathione lyase